MLQKAFNAAGTSKAFSQSRPSAANSKCSRRSVSPIASQRWVSPTLADTVKTPPPVPAAQCPATLHPRRSHQHIRKRPLRFVQQFRKSFRRHDRHGVAGTHLPAPGDEQFRRPPRRPSARNHHDYIRQIEFTVFRKTAQASTSTAASSAGLFRSKNSTVCCPYPAIDRLAAFTSGWLCPPAPANRPNPAVACPAAPHGRSDRAAAHHGPKSWQTSRFHRRSPGRHQNPLAVRATRRAAARFSAGTCFTRPIVRCG